VPQPSRLEWLKSLDAFYLEHRLCSELDGRVEETATGSALVWLDCSACEVRIVRKA
jgi:hypothetical protein